MQLQNVSKAKTLVLTEKSENHGALNSWRGLWHGWWTVVHPSINNLRRQFHSKERLVVDEACFRAYNYAAVRIDYCGDTKATTDWIYGPGRCHHQTNATWTSIWHCAPFGKPPYEPRSWTTLRRFKFTLWGKREEATRRTPMETETKMIQII